MRRPISKTALFLTLSLLWLLPSVARAETLADGSSATIAQGANGYPCTATKAKYYALERALERHRKYAKLAAMQDGVFLNLGERVRAIAHAGRAPSIEQIRIESGDDAGKTCWIPSDVDGSFANVRSH